jgi:hypothetical protein
MALGEREVVREINLNLLCTNKGEKYAYFRIKCKCGGE